MGFNQTNQTSKIDYVAVWYNLGLWCLIFAKFGYQVLCRQTLGSCNVIMSLGVDIKSKNIITVCVNFVMRMNMLTLLIASTERRILDILLSI
jgi:hypothetical protein